MKIYKNLFGRIASLDNLFASWDRFKSDKQKKRDVQEFEINLEQYLFQLHRDLVVKRYKHGAYTGFWIHDPKPRHIHKATVRDRILHHAIFRVLNPVFEPTFIAHSFSCRVGKGTHKGVAALNRIVRQVSRNGHRACFALKCDIQKFFNTVDHDILLHILSLRIQDTDTMSLLREIVASFNAPNSNPLELKGVPIGNLTSQLFVNVYMNEFDQFVKHQLKIKNYIRYTDDFVIISDDKRSLENLIQPVRKFLLDKLALKLHPKKVCIRNLNRGIDFLGYIILPHYRILRTKTKQRIFRKLRHRTTEYKNDLITKQNLEQSLQSYLGVLSHANTYNFSNELKNLYWFWLND